MTISISSGLLRFVCTLVQPGVVAELVCEVRMKRLLVMAVFAAALIAARPAAAQVKMTRDQMMFYTSDWKGDRFPDGRPKLPDDLLTRALDVSIEDVWDYLRGSGYRSQFDSGFQMLHPDKPFAGRAVTAQYMPSRPDMTLSLIHI